MFEVISLGFKVTVTVMWLGAVYLAGKTVRELWKGKE